MDYIHYLFSKSTLEIKAIRPHHDDFFDSTDGHVHKRLEFGLIVQVVSVADAHEEDVSWQTGDHIDHHAFGLQVCEYSSASQADKLTKMNGFNVTISD